MFNPFQAIGQLATGALQATEQVLDVSQAVLDPLDLIPDVTLEPVLNPDYSLYDFDHYDGARHLPKKVKLIPLLERFPLDKLARMGIIGGKAIGASATTLKKPKEQCQIAEYYEQFFNEIEWWNMGEEFLGTLRKSEMANSWDTDENFAAQFIAGVNPMRIRRQTSYEELAADFSLEEKDRFESVSKIASTQEEGDLQTLVQNGKIFIADYPDMARAWTHQIQKIKEGRDTTGFGPAMFIFYDAKVMFYIKDNSHLMPMAIQLVRPEGCPEQTEPQFYTPIAKGEENWRVWLYAKMCVLNTDAQYHEMISHLNYTHLAMEPIYVALQKVLPRGHKLLDLMIPFFEQTLAINNLGRNTLLVPGQVFDQILTFGLQSSLTAMQLRYGGLAEGLDGAKTDNHWDMFKNSFPEDMKSRGFGGVNEEGKAEYPDIPGFYYRSDGAKVWNAYLRFMEMCVDLYIYPTEAAFLEDDRIPILKATLQHPDSGNIPGIKLESRNDLIYFLTTVLWTCSAQHSAVNFGQSTFYSFVPGRPACLKSWMPADPKDCTEFYILKSLANFLQTVSTIGTVSLLSLPTTHAVSIELKLQKQMFDLRVNPVFDDPAGVFKQELKLISAEITKRNETVPQPGFKNVTDFPPYEWLNPNQIPASIAI